MSDRPTPETDAIVRNAATADHPPTRLAATLTVKCEKLERERDEAREERDQFRSLNESYAACWDEIRAALGESEQGDKTCDLDRVLKAIRERDEARELLASEKITRNHIIKRSVEVEIERDEARTELEMWRDGNILHEIHRDELEKVERERDEAREELAGIENKMRVELGGHPDSELWGGAGLIAATMRCVDALDVVTEQRDEAREAWYAMQSSFERSRDEVEKLIRESDEAREQVKELIYIADRAIDLAEIDFENDKFGVVSELRDGLKKIKEETK